MIIGGGIGGLCLAIALRQHGFEATVYEQAKKIEAVGSGLTLWTNAIKVLRRLGVAEEVIESGSMLNRSQIRASNGDVLQDIHTDKMETIYGEPVVAIHRAELHRILMNALPADTLKLGMGFTKFEQDNEKVTVYFDNGTSDSADILIGADGIHSVVRGQMFPDVKLRYSGYSAWRGIAETENDIALGMTSESWGMGARFGIVRVDKKRIYWFATSNQPAGEKISGDQRKTKLLNRFKTWHSPIEHLLEATPADLILQNDICDIAPFPSWSMGRVTLLGDAAHATTPNMGQGACMAIESAYVLSRALKEAADYQPAFERYERERHARTAWITNQSWLIGSGGQIENRWMCALRNFAVRVAPSGVMQSRILRAAGYDATRQLWK
jgi:2-polyprenyl-6-methoxyphenol hydroxylase-like FAD-dependent oxidoreductase